MNKLKLNKFHVATFVALLFHVAGFLGMFTSKQSWFVANTPLHLVIMFALIIWTQTEKNKAFFLFVVIAFLSGMLCEIIGVNTSLLFGNYIYGKVLGAGIKNVPWVIGINWFTVMYCCGVVMSQMQKWFLTRSPEAAAMVAAPVMFISFVADSAVLATFFDFLLEPVAVKLGYWSWLGDGNIPYTNVLSWFLISCLLMAVFRLLRFNKQNQFAVHLLIIELLFFSALRTFL